MKTGVVSGLTVGGVEQDCSDLSVLIEQRPTGDITAEQDIMGLMPAEPVSESPTVLDIGRWNRNRGGQVAAEWRETGATDDWPDEAIGDAGDAARNLVADAHSSLFEPQPKFAERPKEQARAAWWKQLMDTPEFRALRNQTVLDDTLSAIGAKGLCDQWITYTTETESESESEPGEKPTGDTGSGSDGESIEKQIARIRSTGAACKEAAESVKLASDMAGMGIGGDGSVDGGKLNPAAVAAYFRKVRDNSLLRQILDMAGRFRRRARSLQMAKVSAVRGEITGIETSGDVGRLLPSELAMVAGAVPELQTLALYRLAQRSLLSYKHRKVESQRQGPIVICVDTSGSMHGDKVAAAKGLACAMAWVAQHQKRWVCLVDFAGGTEGTYLVIPPNKPIMSDELIEWLIHFYGGGTTLDVPLDTIPHEMWPKFAEHGLQRGKTDIIFITDAIVDCPDDVRDKYLVWAKAEQAKSYGIIIGSRAAGDLEAVCDQIWSVPELDVDSEAVEEMLSL